MSDWKRFEDKKPEDKQACEYSFTVTCKGWYIAHKDEIEFRPDQTIAPICSIESWREWKEGDSLEEAEIRMKEKIDSYKKTQGAHDLGN